MNKLHLLASTNNYPPPFSVIEVEECDSTNNELARLVQAGASTGTIVVTNTQTAGRGRMGRIWYSERGASLTFSLLWRFPHTTPLTGLSLCVGVALVEALHSITPKFNRNFSLKWPNDLLLDQRKLGGVLIEIISRSGSKAKEDTGASNSVAAIIGIGINIHPPTNIPKYLLEQISFLGTGSTYTSTKVLAALLPFLSMRLSEFSQLGFLASRQTWLVHCAHLGNRVVIQPSASKEFQGVCVGVTNEGALQISDAKGLRVVHSGDVSLQIANE